MTETDESPAPRGRPDIDGGLARAIMGDYQLAIGKSLSRGWRQTHGNKWTLQRAGLSYFLALLTATAVVSIPSLLAGAGGAGLLSNGIIGQLVLFAVTIPLNVGLFMTGLVLVRHGHVRATEVFRYFSSAGRLLITAVLMYLLIGIGLLLFVLPGIYLGVAYKFALPLVVDRGLSPWQALETSRKAITHRWFSLFGLNIIASVLATVGILTLGIALIWIFPWLLITYALVYQSLFDQSPTPPGAIAM